MDSPGRPNGNVTIPRLEVQTIHTSSQCADPEIAGLICIKTVDTVVRQLFQTVGLRMVMFKTVPVKTIQSTDIKYRSRDYRWHHFSRQTTMLLLILDGSAGSWRYFRYCPVVRL